MKPRIKFIVVVFAVVFVVGISPALAFTGPSQNPPTGNGAISVSGTNVGVGVSDPSAALEIKAGTVTVAPLKLTAGTNLTTPSAGAIEYNGSSLFFTPSTERKTIILNPMTTAGDLIYGGASGTATRLAIGTAGYYLAVNGTENGFTWTSPGTGTTSAANVSSGTFGANTGGGNYTFPAQIKLEGSSSGTAIITAPAAAGTPTLTLPTTTGTFALTNNKLSVFASTTSSELAGVVSDETGTGSFVLSTSPTLVTPTLGAASATSLSLTTALTIANGGTGAATKAAAFDALSPMTTAGDIIYGGTAGTGTRLAKGTAGQVLTMNAGATAPIWQDPTGGEGGTTSAANVSSGAFGANTGGGNYSFPANLGLGTTTPSSKLHVYGDGYSLFGPNSTWGAYLRVGGNGNVTNDASVVATNGNLHLDAASGAYATYINFYHGTGGINFGNGASGTVASINTS
ncbi:MAG: hypothetical protein PHP35_00935, partial [Candidatus Colwellbacteria bacterium]|nr:hypothetical protein [Candidatus Colwellbacteria bacterium]